ncbi:hypothetical protein VN97_g6020 [Penicillium thymicola]|uniref:Uncharacterized protein n=1 Tax=Penicillium thymicola TaxID=293382 RepID=A0AAI9X849_PENTH|nr:hypothetical protein VN97_g6020 [Penicillium thymicola]
MVSFGPPQSLGHTTYTRLENPHGVTPDIYLPKQADQRENMSEQSKSHFDTHGSCSPMNVVQHALTCRLGVQYQNQILACQNAKGNPTTSLELFKIKAQQETRRVCVLDKQTEAS